MWEVECKFLSSSSISIFLLGVRYWDKVLSGSPEERQRLSRKQKGGSLQVFVVKECTAFGLEGME